MNGPLLLERVNNCRCHFSGADENAACHIALGSAYRNGIDGGSAMSEEEWASAGGNTSLIHVDFMIGSGKMDVFGVDASGNEEPVLKQGEWAFTVRARQ